MTRTDAWLQTNNVSPLDGGWSTYVLNVVDLSAGDTLMRSRVDLQIATPVSSAFGGVSYGAPWDPAQYVAALCWSTEGPPTGYYEEVFADWIFVQQISFESFTWNLPDIDGNLQGYGYVRNSIETRTLDSKAQRVAPEGGSVYLVLDATGNGDTAPEVFGVVAQVTARFLIKQPAE
jgi:hypothetical protein